MNESQKPDRVQLYVERLRRQSRRYAEQLYSELEKLRGVTASLEKEHRVLSEQNGRYERELETVEQLRTELDRLRDDNSRVQADLRRTRELNEFYANERADLRVRLSEIEAESSRYAMQYLDVEEHNTALANLYVSIHQLHSTLDRDELLGGIKEIIINLIGSEELAIFERHGDSLQLIGSFGVDERALAELPLDDGSWIGEAVSRNEIFVREGQPARIARDEYLTACVPFRLGDAVTGAVAVFRLLQQKPALASVDHELFELLATHAGTALYTTQLHAQRMMHAQAAAEIV